jgi:hypothetical protein
MRLFLTNHLASTDGQLSTALALGPWQIHGINSPGKMFGRSFSNQNGDEPKEKYDGFKQ